MSEPDPKATASRSAVMRGLWMVCVALHGAALLGIAGMVVYADLAGSMELDRFMEPDIVIPNVLGLGLTVFAVGLSFLIGLSPKADPLGLLIVRVSMITTSTFLGIVMSLVLEEGVAYFVPVTVVNFVVVAMSRPKGQSIGSTSTSPAPYNIS